jgi:hypothetical protein
MLLFMNDEAWFHLSGLVNAQNTCHWDTENPHAVHEVPLHDQKVGPWCAVSGQKIIRPVFFLQHGEPEALCEQHFGTLLSNPH